MKLSTIENKIELCEHKTGVFHSSALQLLNKLSHNKMCPSALRHPAPESIRTTFRQTLRTPTRLYGVTLQKATA